LLGFSICQVISEIQVSTTNCDHPGEPWCPRTAVELVKSTVSAKRAAGLHVSC